MTTPRGAERTDRTRRVRAVFGALTLLSAATAFAVSGTAASAASCAATDPGGGSWPSYGHDLTNSRTQPAETTISAANVTTLAPKWTFTTAAGGGGAIESTPVVADGCMFVGTSTGRVSALNADTGDVVWSQQVVSPSTTAGFGGLIVGAPAVDSGNVIVAVNALGKPYVVALAESTGAQRWASQPLDSASDGPWGNVAGENASPTVWGGKVLLGFYGAEFDPRARGGFTILDEATGARLAHTYTISDADYALGYRGASVWTTAAVDPVARVAYIGTGNPGGTPAAGTSPSQFPECGGTLPGQQCHAALEDPKADALLQVDVDPTHATFGQLLSSYKGNPDNYVAGAYNQPACATLGSEVEVGTSPPAGAWSVPCAQLDLDFGASPNLFVNPADGSQLVGDLQKSGVYHAAHAATMAPAWQTVMGAPCPACNGASTAVTSGGVFGEGTPGGMMMSLAPGGGYQWATPVGDGLHYESTSTANGIVYSVDTAGFLDAFDAAHGVPVLRRSIGGDVGQAVGDLSSAGVAIARHTVYAAYGSAVVAYQPGPVTPPKPPAATLPAGSPIVAGPASFLAGYYTPSGTMPAGGSINFQNYDLAPHNVMAFDPATGTTLTGPDTADCAANGFTPGTCPLFFSKTITIGATSPVLNTGQLQSGRTYAFYCTIHPKTMRGTLTVT